MKRHKPKYKNSRYQIYLGKSEHVLKSMPSNSVHSIVCDPPYELGFMGKKWDNSGIAYSVELWKEALRVLKPGGHLLAFSGSRTYHRMVVAIEDAGFEVRDQIMWVYGSGFPKSLNVGKAIDATLLTGSSSYSAMADVEDSKHAGLSKEDNSFISYGKEGSRQGKLRHGARRKKSETLTVQSKQWDGWGTALKPAHEPICVARKPFKGTVAANILTNGVGALNIDACRVPADGAKLGGGNNSATVSRKNKHEGWKRPWMEDASAATIAAERSRESTARSEALGRWPANVIHDGSPEVIDSFAVHGEKNGGHHPTKRGKGNISTSGHSDQTGLVEHHADKGTAARFFYCAKANRKDRDEGLGAFPSSDEPTMGSGIGGQPNQQMANNKNVHPTVKPTDLMRYLVRLVTPPNGIVLDPFMGSGSTGKAAMLESFRFAGIDMTPEYVEISRARIRFAMSVQTDPQPGPNKAKIVAPKPVNKKRQPPFLKL